MVSAPHLQLCHSERSEESIPLHARADGTRLFRILSRRYAFDGERTAILEEMGTEFGLSRERIHQLQQKTLRSCGGRSHRQFVEDGLQRCAERFVGRAGQERASAGRADPAMSSSLPIRMSAAAPSTRVWREPGAADPDDIEFVAALIAVILGQLPDGLSAGMLTHILAGSSGPVVDAVVQHYRLRQYAILERLGFARVKALVGVTCHVDSRFVRVNGRIRLVSGASEHPAHPERLRPGRTLAEA
jgi:hypothetical protein